MAQPEMQDLLEQGVRPQRPLWASTGTKNPAYSDVLYVDSLIGPDTVNTVPPDTLEAFLDHGQVRPTLEEGVAEALNDLERLRGLGVDLDAATQELESEGVRSFQDSWDKLLAGMQQKARELARALTS
jgi:transaldolase